MAAGTEGVLVVASEEGELGAGVVERFLWEAGGGEARVVVVGWGDDVGRLVEVAGEVGVAGFSVVREVGDLEGVTGVWVVGDAEVDCGVVGGRAGVIGGRVPGGVMGAATEGSVGYEIAAGAALVVKGRRVSAVGEVEVGLAAGAGREGLVRRLEGEMDLTALRRSAVGRAGEVFPPAEMGVARVESGTLVIVGGGGMPKGLMGRFVELAGGVEEAKIVVVPISMPEPLPEEDGMEKSLRGMGVKTVTVLRGRTPEVVDGEESLAALREATGIWFGGGRQWRFYDAYVGTEARELMVKVLERGGVIGGSSAGASIQPEYMARGNPMGSREIMEEGYERGLGFLPGVAVDQHFSQRNRFGDLASLVDRYPQILGIGIDETTALVVEGSVAEVVGRGAVHFYDRRKPVVEGEPDHESLPAGERYDLVARERVQNGG